MFLNSKIELFKAGPDNYGIVIRSGKSASRKMRILNQVTGRYPDGTIFNDTDEPVFFFNAAQIERMAVEVPFLGKIFTQIGLG